MFLGLGLGLQFGARPIASGGTPAPSFAAPDLTLDDNTTNPPQWSMTTGDAETDVDTFRLIWDDNSGFSTPETYDHVFTSDDALLGYIDWEGLVPWGPFAEDATIYWKIEVYRSAVLMATSDTLSATILDVTPAAFDLGAITDADTSTSYESNEITVSGLSASASVPVTITGGEYQKNGAAWTSAAGTARNGDDFEVRGTSSALGATAANVTLSIGGVSDTFTITTAGSGIVATPSAAEPMINIVFADTSYTFQDVDFIAGLAVVTVVSSHRRISALTIGGNAATLVSQSQAANDSPHASVWQYDGITAGDHDIVLTGPGGLAIMAVQAVTLVGANPTPFDTAIKPEGASGDPQVTTTALDVAAGGWGICGVYGDTAGADPTWNTGAELVDTAGDRRFTAATFTASAMPSVSGLGFGTAMAAASWEPA